MKVPIRFNGVFQEAEIEYVTRSEFGFLSEWRDALGGDKHPVRMDAVIFASLACKRYTAHFQFENYAQRAADIDDHIRDNPHSEVANLVVMKCDWFPESKMLGIAHFRRSWCNNLILDYLAAHPWIASPPPHYKNEISGVGIGLLWFLCDIAVKHRCELLWGEATQNSCEFYRRVFDLESVRDLLYIPQQNLAGFAKSLREKWRAGSR